MLLNRFLAAVPVRGELDRCALAVHTTFLEHGFICVGCADGESAPSPVLAAGASGNLLLQVLPSGWNAMPDSYSFCYVHPLRGQLETFTVKAIAIANSLAVHGSSSLPGAELLTATLAVEKASEDPEAIAKRLQDWQEKVASLVALRLLSQQNSTARFARQLEASEKATAASSGTKRPAPEVERPPAPDFDMDERTRPFPGIIPGIAPFRDPFSPDFFGDDRPFFPHGGLLGPRHPAWGQVRPGGNGGGMMPRFDPIGPGTGEPDPDHLRVPGLPGAGDLRDPFFAGRARRDPDGMFDIM